MEIAGYVHINYSGFFFQSKNMNFGNANNLTLLIDTKPYFLADTCNDHCLLIEPKCTSGFKREIMPSFNLWIS